MGLWIGSLTVGLAACAFQRGAAPSDAVRSDAPLSDQNAPGIDGSPDAPLDAPLPAGCFGTQGESGYYVCDPRGAPMAALTLNMTAYNSDNCNGGAIATVLGTQVCMLDGAGVTVMDFEAVGNNPIVIASTTTIDIVGLLDVSTIDGPHHGAGHNPTQCNNNGINGGNGGGGQGGGGGAGGSFGTAGGNGGQAMGGGASGNSNGPQTPATLRGGCLGGIGGNGNNTNNGGTPGWGGGAVWVVAYGKIAVADTGKIDASGERGYHGATNGGAGSGGGSGGMILLDGHPLTLSALANVISNGGGAGGGADSGGGAGHDGSDGNDPDATMPLTAAPGGNGNGNGQRGGSGASQGNAAQPGLSANGGGGGGGGGGGMGVILVLAGGVPAASDHISPTAVGP